MEIGDNNYELTPVIHEALTSTGYSDRKLKIDNDISVLNITLNDIGYTGDGYVPSKR